MPKVSRKAATRSRAASPKTHAVRSRTKAKPKNGKRRKKISWYARQKQKVTDFRDRIVSYKAHAIVVVVLLAAVGLYGSLAAGVGDWAIDEASDVSRSALIASGLSVEQIRVEGRNRADLEEVRAAIGVVQGDSILHFDVAAARSRLEDIDWVEDAKVIRFLPRTIHVVITERRPIAIWQMDGNLHLVDNSGFVLEEFRDEWAMDLPLVVGAGASGEAARLLDAVGRHPFLRANFASAIRVADRRWNLRLSNGVEIRLPAENIDFALERIVEYNDEYDLLGQEIKSVDLRLPDRVYLKLTDEESDRLWAPKSKA
jgi:cell division protein FtsQ